MPNNTTTSNNTTTCAPGEVDVRAQRFTATVTATVLVAVLVISRINVPAAVTLLAVQAVVFGIGAVAGPARHPYGVIYASVVAPRLAPVTKCEPVPPLRFAQLIGFIMTTLGVIGFALAYPVLGIAATGFALVGAFFRAAFGICLSRRLFLLVNRLRTGEVPACCRKD